MLALIALVALASGLIGAFLGRLKGGGPGPKLPRPLDQMLFSLPVLLLYFIGVPLWLTALGYIWMVVWTLTGHGGFMDLGTWVPARAQERLEFLIAWLYDKLPLYWYDALGLAVTGFVPVLVAGVSAIAYGAWPVGVTVLLTGILKAASYMVSKGKDWSLWNDEPTERGEYLFGFETWHLITLATGLWWYYA